MVRASLSLVVSSVVFSGLCTAEGRGGHTASEVLGKLPLAFIENRGQVDERARFVCHGGGATAYFNRCFHRYVLCDPSLVGTTGYLQFIALKPAGGVDGLSNQSAVTVVDHGACG